MNVETQIHLDKFKPYEWQVPFLDALENKDYKRVIGIVHRRGGKDIMAFNFTIRECIRKVGTYLYCLPTFAHARRTIWNYITMDSMRMLDYIPPELILKKREDQMQIVFTNGSVLQLTGSDKYDSTIRGQNFNGIVFSEWAYCDPNAYYLGAQPVLARNNGWAIFITTPNGSNHAFEMFEMSKRNPEWYGRLLTIKDTGLMNEDDINRIRAEGRTSEDVIQQEYYCSFQFGNEGAYYLKYLNQMRLKGQIGFVGWDPTLKVHTSTDWGVRDPSCIVFFQVSGNGNMVRIIDYYENANQDMPHYCKVMENKPYNYGFHFAPHDVRKRNEMLTSREIIAEQLGFKFTVLERTKSILDDIELVKATLPRVWIDENNCKDLIKALENYRQEYDAKLVRYKGVPLHDWSSHGADAVRAMAVALPLTYNSTSAEDLDRRYREAVGGNQSNLPAFFRNERY